MSHKLGAVIFPSQLQRKKAGHNKRGENKQEKEGCLLGKAELSSNRTGCLAR